MGGYQVGEVVDITIKGVRVAGDQGPRGTVTIIADDGGHYVMPPQAAVERVAPAEWPPQVGDLWLMRGGSRCVCVRDFDAPAGYEVAMVNVANGDQRFLPHELVPVELLYRQDGGLL